MKKNIVTVFLAFISSVYFVSALTISPARIEISADPGSVTTGEFLLLNEQNNEETFFTTVENFEAQGESGTPNFSTSKEGLASWIDVTKKITLKKGERIKVPFTINTPLDADAGGHFAAIFLSTVPPTSDSGEVSIGAKVGMLVLFKVSGDVKEGGGITSFTLKNNSSFMTSLPVDFVYRFSNTGNDRVNPSGYIRISNTIGMETTAINANQSSGNILPNSIRRFDVRWGNNDPLDENANFFDNVKYQYRNFAFGLYTAHLGLNFGTSSTDSKVIRFFIFPWQLTIIIFIILYIIYIILKIILVRYNRYIIKQAKLHGTN